MRADGELKAAQFVRGATTRRATLRFLRCDDDGVVLCQKESLPLCAVVVVVVVVDVV